jgi:dCMP deaminase
LDDCRAERQVRPEKYAWIEHAERNAIFNVARRGGTSLKNCTIYISQFLPCSDCARAIIQTGITDVVVSPVKIPKRWSKDFKLAANMLHEAGVAVRHPNEDSGLAYGSGSEISVFK